MVKIAPIEHHERTAIMIGSDGRGGIDRGCMIPMSGR